MPQKGSAAIIFILIILVIAGGIIGGTFYIKTNNPAWLHEITSNPQTQTNKTSTASLSPQPKEFRGTLQNKVIFFVPSLHEEYAQSTMYIGDAQGKNLQPFNQELSKNIQFIKGMPPVSPDFQNVLVENDDFNADPNSEYFILSINGKNMEKIDLDKIKKTLNSTYVRISGWSSDGKKLVLITLGDKGNDVIKEHIVSEYDIQSSNLRKIFSKEVANGMVILFYDSGKKILVYTDPSYVLGKKAHLVNLDSYSEIEFDAPNIFNSYGTYAKNSQFFETFGTFFATSNTPNRSQNRTQLNIFSISDPKILVSQVKLEETGSEFDDGIIWSPNYKYFAVKVIDSTSGDKNSLRIYDRNGKLVMSKPLEEPLRGFAYGSLFSIDEKYFMLVNGGDPPGSTLSHELGKPTIQAFEVETGNEYISKYMPEIEMRPVFWY